MSTLEKKIKNGQKKVSSKPQFFKLNSVSDRKKLEALVNKDCIAFVTDEYEVQLEEYFQVQNPKLVYHSSYKKEFKKFLQSVKKRSPLWQHGTWVYYPWISHLVHILDEDKFFQVRTARNKNLITEKEQEKFYNAQVGIAGLSVGNSVALAIVLQGGAKRIKIADHDTLELSNINRIRTGIDNLGIKKVDMTAREIYLLNPYAKVKVYKEGLTKNNIKEFFNGLDIIVDEIDNLAIKYLIREHAKKNKIAVVMGADNGDNAIIDIERYDLKKQPKFFHGRMGLVTYENLIKLNKFDTGKKIVKLLGIENISERTISSFFEMGKTIVSWPQLGGAAILNGTAIAYCVRNIITNQSINDNRAIISLDKEFHKKVNKSMDLEKLLG